MKSVEYKVDGMTCSGCENSVKKVIKQLPGVHEVEASHIGKTVFVYYDEKQVKEGDIMNQVKKLGYQVEVK
ncbi:cation transporter [Mycoplasmatota bacterium]|nr:cation transporter [Mycoplasmatota bacterium]